MLKLTEAELVEMGFRKNGWSLMWRPKWMNQGEGAWGTCIGFVVEVSHGWAYGTWWVDPNDGVCQIYPQTKEDLLTLIRLFTPPQEVKDVN